MLARMALKPERAAERLEEVFRVEVGRAASQLRELVLETFDLVAAHLPELNVAAARKRFTTNPTLAASRTRQKLDPDSRTS